MVGAGDFVSLLRQLVAQLQGFDEDALVALANRGLFRRATKDLAQQSPTLLENAGRLQLSFAGHQIEFDSNDPRSARCDCKATSVCHHQLAVLLWLKEQSNSAPELALAPSVDTPPPADAAMDADTLLLSFDDAALKAFAGAATFRHALSYALDLDLECEFAVSGQRYLVLKLPRLQFELRCVGTTLTQFIASGPPAQAAKLTIAALLAYRRHRGQALPSPESRETDAHELMNRARLLQQRSQFALELIELGLTHLSPAITQRAESLATWSAALGCYRLAARLRRCCEQIDAALARLAHSDSEALLDELAFVYALAQGLQQALNAGQWPRALLGQARHDYEESDALTLWALAAWPFQSASGFKGLSVLFYAPEEGEFLSLTEARPASLGFDPVARFSQFGPWRGMTSPAATLAQAIVLHQPRRAGSRLSAHEASWVQSSQALTVGDYAALPQLSQWRAWSSSGARSLWQTGTEEFACLKPSAWRPSEFDPHRQRLHWSLLDDRGDELVLSLPYSLMHARAVSAFEHFTRKASAADSLILVRRHDDGVQPIGWLQQNGVKIQAGAPFFNESLDTAAQNVLAQTPPVPPAAMEHPELRHWRHFLLAHAERGISAQWPEALAQQRTRAQAYGLLKLAALTANAPAAECLLRSWVYLQQLSAALRTSAI